ncbi:hypothetical protein A3F37_00085 [Candidatus Saccharibacteria bacterium RIFCSPHIGHO2_12_FULL_41_12]|nr:MAG: hypothetical protein A3F37_00085 [Candidatus Saccharibacteria bacterium RIFCSPHIGHO2_12_FULL_41_12]
MKTIEEKLKQLPATPGVYFHKDKSAKIIYVGKAANLRNRVRQYFQVSRLRDTKTDALVADIKDIDWLEVTTEMDALFIEAEMIRRYRPKYNILLRDDKSFIYVRIDKKSDHPTVRLVRRPQDDGAEYIGPFQSKYIVDKALRYLRRAFPYSTHFPTVPSRACLQAQLGLCPGLEANMTPLSQYRHNLTSLTSYLKGSRVTVIKSMEKSMNALANNHEFEQAAKIRNQLTTLKYLDNKTIFSDIERLDLARDHALNGLKDLLNLPKPPLRIEGFDISHMSGTDNVASNVVFVAGLPDKSSYRKFKMKLLGNDDFAHMKEVMTRRFSEKNIKSWGKPDLILIDGGKGQVSSALGVLDSLDINIPLLGLAKQFEEIIVPKRTGSGYKYQVLSLGLHSEVVKLLQRIRDESHRFALSYHTTLKRKRQSINSLDLVPGIGPSTRKLLLRKFGSYRGIVVASQADIQAAIGPHKAKVLQENLQNY